MNPTLPAQLACVRRWHTYAARLCPAWVAQGRMTEPELAHELTALAAAVRTLAALAQGETSPTVSRDTSAREDATAPQTL
jgi:hypothetical protein